MIIEKLDLTKTDPNYYKVGNKPELRDLDPYFYLTIEGKSAPEDDLFGRAVEALYSIAYGIKFRCKGEDMDFTVPKMEGLWYLEGGVTSLEQFQAAPRSEWCWKIMIRMPDFVEESHFFRAMESAKVKKPELESISQVKFELINEGQCAQILHLGSYDHEEETVKLLHHFIEDQQLQMAGEPHEIYLSDPRKTEPEKLKTIIRYPVKSKSL